MEHTYNMNKKMLIDASYKEETRIVVVDGSCIEDYDVESSTKKQLKGNIYLAKVIRIEPSLQAAFVDYGGNRHGFLAFSEIHPDYYQIPIADRNELVTLQNSQPSEDKNPLNETTNESVTENEDTDQSYHFFDQLGKNYKIQEVIHKRQILLVQVVKEERGNKGAALTTYLSLAGRYCVLMPNSLKSGGISRKITSPSERRRLKDIISELNIPSHMGMIVRTAGAQCSKPDALRDGEYLLRLWDEVRDRTLKAIAPTLIYEDSSLLKRAIRDNYTSDINEILIDGEEGWIIARDYMKALMPQNIRKLHLWRDQKQSLFSHYKIENLLDKMLSPIVQLKSGGYLVINQTEALVAIDVNSGRSIKERDLEDTALRTNQEAAEEIVRQLRLRDLAGLIVIDFIDMENKKHNFMVERRLKNALSKDRARIQVGSISMFGLLEMTRQRLRPSIAEFAFMSCSHCNGTGIIRSVENIGLHILRQIDGQAKTCKPGILTVHLSSHEIALYLLNLKRQWLMDIENKYKLQIILDVDNGLQATQIKCHHETSENIETENETDKIDYLFTENTSVREIPIQAQSELTEEHPHKEQNGRRKRFRRSRNEYQRFSKEENRTEPADNNDIEPATIIHPIEISTPSSELSDADHESLLKPDNRGKYSNRYPRQPRWKRNKFEKQNTILHEEPPITVEASFENNNHTDVVLIEPIPNDTLTSALSPDAEIEKTLSSEIEFSSETTKLLPEENQLPNEDNAVEVKKPRRSPASRKTVNRGKRKPAKVESPALTEHSVDLAIQDQPAVEEELLSTASINANPDPASFFAEDLSTTEQPSLPKAPTQDSKSKPKTKKTPIRRAVRSKKEVASVTPPEKKVKDAEPQKPQPFSKESVPVSHTDEESPVNRTPNYQPVQPIVIDDSTPSNRQKAGWWKR